MLLKQITQEIVNMTMKIIGNRSISIIDKDGFIIASDRKNRINTYHECGAQVIKYGKTIEVYPDEIYKFEAAKEGINMPIKLESEVIGAVSVYGHPDDVRNITRMLKMFVELSLRHYFLSEQVKHIKDLKQQLVRMLIYEDITKRKEEILFLSKVIGINLSKKRCVVIIDIENYQATNAFKVLNFMEQLENILIQKRYITEYDFDIILNRSLILFKSIPVLYFNNKTEFLNGLYNEIKLKAGNGAKVAMGSFHKDLQGYQQSFDEAKKLIEISKSFPQDMDSLSARSKYLLNQVNKDMLEHFVKPIYESLLDSNGKIPKWIIDTMKAMFENNLNTAKASMSLYIHRNTLLYRMKKIEKLTGLSLIDNFYHAVLLNLLMIYITDL